MSIESALDDVLRKATQRGSLLGGAIWLARDERAGERLTYTLPVPLDLQRSRRVIDRLDRYSFPGRRVHEATLADLVLLRGKAQGVQHRTRARGQRDRIDAGGDGQPPQRLVVHLGQLLLVGFKPLEICPIARLGLAPVVVEQLGHQPAGVLVVVPVLRVLGDASGERGVQRVELRLQLGVWLPRLGWRLPRDLLAELLDRLVATVEQPFAQEVGGTAVVLVVALDRSEEHTSELQSLR